ncbi:cupin (plasmid) [Vibrio nigripulchritudo]|uniref:Cupin 2, conserved barrel n=1 Tax=Vibrio nigripulchritudo SOn1 TaxID=1238450 RepID=A0AAV2VYW6_9VIBR|nr:cupin domain-containing protein [Vibrio nigripulchritudo]BCL73669.1 cupin [Vibrio nigripulchritudo]BDU35039.1 cupin [Vibrio nigripulchritudo]CCO49592.1 Cupin 2, conserved barrel [Vibrio nigripulchritudo SOn1]
MNSEKVFEAIQPTDVEIPEGQSLSQWIESRVARYETRRLDWNALKFQADYDPIYKRAQMRYLGTGATGIANDSNVVPAENFTFSTMVLPAGCEGPSHIHTDAEEVFFILKGHKIRLFIEHLGETVETVLTERDLISVPPGVYRGLRNEGIEEALMCVMIGNPKPVIPTYPEDHPVSKLKR